MGIIVRPILKHDQARIVNGFVAPRSLRLKDGTSMVVPLVSFKRHPERGIPNKSAE